MGGKNFGERMNTLFSPEGTRHDEYRPEKLLTGNDPKDRPLEDVLFRQAHPEVVYELVVPSDDEASLFQETTLVELITNRNTVELPVQKEIL